MNNPIKPNFKTEIIPIALLIIAGLASFYFYAHFPAVVPTHWGFSGEPDGWSGPGVAAFLLPVICLGIYLLMLFYPMLDPQRDRYAEFAPIYHKFKTLIVGFMVIIYFLASFNGIGFNLPIGTITPIMVGLLFVAIGNYMGKIKLNWSTGTRNMWSLSSETVWNKSNRLSGKLFILAGLAMMIQPMLPMWLRLPWFIITILTIVVVPTVYSYLLYREEQKTKNQPK